MSIYDLSGHIKPRHHRQTTAPPCHAATTEPAGAWVCSGARLVVPRPPHFSNTRLPALCLGWLPH